MWGLREKCPLLPDVEPSHPPRQLFPVLSELPWIPELKYDSMLLNLRAELSKPFEIYGVAEIWHRNNFQLKFIICINVQIFF